MRCYFCTLITAAFVFLFSSLPDGGGGGGGGGGRGRGSGGFRKKTPEELRQQREEAWTRGKRGMLNAIDRRSVFERENDLAIERRVMPVLADRPRLTKG